MGGGLPWIHMALSTLKPATSSHLSAIRLNFAWQSSAYQTVETAIEGAGDDLRRITDEVTRIEREFEGAMNLTVVWDSGFKSVLDKLNVRFHSCGVKLIHFYSPLADPLVLRSLQWDLRLFVSFLPNESCACESL